MQNDKPVANGRAILPGAQELGTRDGYDTHVTLDGLRLRLDAVLERVARLEQRSHHRPQFRRRTIWDAVLVAAVLTFPAVGLILLWRFL
jgi:hypothetical protein